MILALLLWLGLHNQPYYPRPWLDEGFALQGAMNLARHGQYAMRSSEGFRTLDQPLIANGPGLVLPMAASFAAFGVGFLQARLVSVGFLVLAGLAFYALASRLYGRPAAMVSTLLLLAVPTEGFLFYGRSAVGIVPALMYFLVGYLLWLAALERPNKTIPSLVAGVFFGLAMITKSQYVMILPAGVLLAIVDRFYYRTIGGRRIALLLIGACSCLGLWFLAQWLILGPEGWGGHLQAIRSSTRVTLLALRLRRIIPNVGHLVSTGLPLMVAPGLLYGAWLCGHRAAESCRPFLLVVLVPAWLIWYVFGTNGWSRYALDAYMLGLVLTGKLVVDILRAPPPASEHCRRRRAAACACHGARLLAAAIILVGAWGLVGQTRRILAQPDRALEQLGAYLRDHIGPDAVVESWDWQVDVLADLRYHHPENAIVDDMTAVKVLGDEPRLQYDPLQYDPDYLIDGPWSRWAGLYAPYLQAGSPALVFSAHPYYLYKVDSSQQGSRP